MRAVCQCVVVRPGPARSRRWPALFCRRLCTVTQGLVGPLHRVCCAAPSSLCVRCRTAWCCAPHCTVCPSPHCTCGQWAVAIRTSAMHCHAAGGHWAAQLRHCTASLLVGSEQHSSCFALPQRPGALGCGNPATHCLTAWGHSAVELLSCFATLPGGSGCCNSCNTPPHYLTAWGQWAVQLLQRTASLLISYKALDVGLCEGGPIGVRGGGGGLGGQRLPPALRRGVMPCIHCEATHDIIANTVDSRRQLPWCGVQPFPWQL